MGIDVSILIIGVLFIVSILVINFTTVRPYLNNKNEIKNKERIDNQRRLFADLSPELLRESLNNYISEEVDKYIGYNFAAQKIQYIKHDDAEKMVKKLTHELVLNTSELYIFYLSMLVPINTDDDLVAAIYKMVLDTSIDKVAAYNEPVTSENVSIR